MKRVKRTKLGSPGFFLGFKVNPSIYLVVMYIIQGGANTCFFNLCKLFTSYKLTNQTCYHCSMLNTYSRHVELIYLPPNHNSPNGDRFTR